MFTHDYIAQAMTTVPPTLHVNKVPQNLIANGLEAIARAGNALDDVKKALVYGRDIPEGSQLYEIGGYTHDHPIDLHRCFLPPAVLHGIIGMITEDAEIAEAAMTAIVGGDTFDLKNLREELGDKLWYMARILSSLAELYPEDNWTFDGMMSENVAKLANRHKKTEGQTFNPAAVSEAGRDREGEKVAMNSAKGKTVRQLLMDLENVTAIAVSPGNAEASDYLRGLANGLIMAQSIMRGVEPEYLMPAEPLKSPASPQPVSE